MSAVAERAGVRRSTLYRHFPDEDALFDACSSHWAAHNPPPDPTPWSEIRDPGERLRVALGELYPWFRRNESMMSNILRDAEMPVVRRNMAGFLAYTAAIQGLLLAGRGRAPKATRGAIGHAISFTTWRSLALEQGLSDAAAAGLMSRLVDG